MARTVGKTETNIGYGILLVLVVVAVGVFLRQFTYNPAVMTAASLKIEGSVQPASQEATLVGLLQFAPDGLTPLSTLEVFGPENLSDKIDGKAELYLSAKFVRLLCQRLALEDEADAWMEAFIYDMGSTRGSFAVYSMQRRFEAEELDLSKFAYATENALFFIHGQYYVEIISAVSSEKMAELMHIFGSNFVRKAPASRDNLRELALFPSDNLDRETISLLASDAFGFHRFDSVFTAQYTTAETESTAFISERKSPSEAVELVEAYCQFLLANGGTEVKTSLDIPGAKLVNIMDTFELVFSQGKIVAGVHGAEDKDSTERLGLELNLRLLEVST